VTDNDTRRPNLYLVPDDHEGGDPPQRNVARKTAAPGRRGVWGTGWRVEKGLQDSPGLAFTRWYLARFDFSQLESITVRRSPRSSTSWLSPTGLIRIGCNIPSVRYPAPVPEAEKPSSGERQPYYLNDESETVVAIIAFQVGQYLADTGQIVGVEAIDLMQVAVAAYRRNIGVATSGDDGLPGTLAPHASARWCVLCGKSLSNKGGGSHSFCSPRCRWTYHNRLRGARLAARRGKKVCEVCGAEFTPKKSDAETCSPACRQKKYRRKLRKLRKDRSNPGHDDHRDRGDLRHDHHDPGDHDHDDRQDRTGLHERV
jgi:predicted nucleic acid-binding Zn ribbon protein